jgi:hypothetical protein
VRTGPKVVIEESRHRIERTAVANVSVSARRYVGQRPFAAGDRQLFFGRTVEARAVLERWAAGPFTMLYGPAGTGRTSLIRAAVVPLAEAAGRRRTILPVGRIGPPTVAGPGNPLVAGLLGSWARSPADLAALTVAGFLRRAAEQPGTPAAEPSGPPRVFAVVDQFESAFREEVREPDRAELLDQMVEAVRQVSGLHLLVSVREEYLPELAELESRLGHAARYRLGPLGPDAAREAVRGPLRGGRQAYRPGVAEEVVRNLRTSRIVDVLGGSREVVAGTVEPAQLQAVCSALWQDLPAGTAAVTVEHLYSEGDIDGALVRFCERAVRDVAAAQQVPDSELWSWLARTFVTDLGTRGAAYQGVAGVGGMPKEVAGQFADRHVLTAEHRLGSRWYLLPNDRLIAPVGEGASRWGAGEAAAGGPNPVASLVAAEGALAAGNLALSAQRAAEAVRTSGGRDLRTRASAMSCLGEVAARGGRDQDAESHYRAAAALFDVMQDQAGTGRLLAELGRILLRSGRYAEAVAQLQGAETRLPGDLAVQIDLARALRRSGQLWAATAVLGATLTIAPGAVEALVERGLIRIETGEFSCALDDLDNAVRLRPSVGHQAEIRSARAFARARLGRTA